jgi:hypothetical protein
VVWNTYADTLFVCIRRHMRVEHGMNRRLPTSPPPPTHTHTHPAHLQRACVRIQRRYLGAIQSRGNLAVHFNGGTVAWGWTGSSHANPDNRFWGGGYWFQNTRMLYWYMLGSGDFDLLAPLFNMYVNISLACVNMSMQNKQTYKRGMCVKFACAVVCPGII